MKNHKSFRLIVFSVLCLVLSISGFAQDNFTGEVKMRMSESEGRAFDISYLVKDNLIRFGTDMEGQKMGIIFNSEKNVMLMIMDEQKMYMEMPMDMINKQMDKKGNNTDSENKFTATGETKEIIGYASEKWLYEDEKNKAEVWLTKDIGKFKFFEGGLGGMQKTEGWQSSIEKSGSFPVLVINRDKSGNELNRLEVLSVEKKELDDILFTVPSGYKKFDMPKMN